MKKEYKNYLIIVGVILLVILITTRLTYLFGSDTDWINQHTIFPDYFRNVFYSLGRLTPNLAIHLGGGQNMFNLSYYGLLSPVYLISYLLPFLDMTTYTTIINILLTVLASILFYKWLKGNNYDDKTTLLTTIIFTLAGPFIFHMHRHVMFVNYMPFLILCLMGVDKYFKEDNKTLFVISVFLMIMTSYYYSVGGILVIGIYYLYKYFKEYKANFKTFIKDLIIFMGYGLVGVMLASIILMPTIYTMLSGRGESETSMSIISLLVPYLKIHKLFCGTYAIGTSLIGFIALIYLFYTKKRENVIVASLISIVLFIPLFMYLLNGGLYLREKCFIPFLPLIAYFVGYFINDILKSLVNGKKFSIIILIILALLYYWNRNEECYIFAIIFTILLFFSDKKYVKPFVIASALIFSSIQCVYENLNEEFVTYDEYSEFFDKDVSEKIDSVLVGDKSYYRTVNLFNSTKTVNKVYGENYFTTSIYSSNYNNYYLDFIRNVFMTSTRDYNYFLISSPNDMLFNMFMGVKYIISSYNPGVNYKKIDENVYMSENVLPMFYGRSHILNENEFDLYNYPYKGALLLNNVVASTSSENSITDLPLKKKYFDYKIKNLDGVEITKSETGYVLNVEDNGVIDIDLNETIENQILYIELTGLKENTCRIDNISMTINNIENVLTCKTWTYPNKNNTFRFAISEDKLDSLHIVLNKGTFNITSINTYVLDYSLIENIKSDIDVFNISKFDNDEISGFIDMKNDGYFVTSLPYDRGFEVSIDGNVVEKEVVNKAFLGVKISSGKHDIKIKYATPLYKEGMIMSLIGALIFIFIMFDDIRKKRL